jgi:hypothetical protein
VRVDSHIATDHLSVGPTLEVPRELLDRMQARRDRGGREAAALSSSSIT